MTEALPPGHGEPWENPATGESGVLDFSHMANQKAYREYYEKLTENPAYDRLLYRESMAHVIGLIRNSSVLDLGSGTGGNMYVLASLGNEVFGVECSHVLVDRFYEFRDRAPHGIAKRMDMVCTMIEGLDLGRTFDWVLCTETLEHVMDPVEILRIARLHAKDGGRLFVAAPSTRRGTSSHVRGVSPANLEEWCGRTGWVIVKCLEEPLSTKLTEISRTICIAEAK